MGRRNRWMLSGCQIDLDERTVTRHDRTLELAPREVAVLEVLLRESRRTVSRETLSQEVWGDADAGRALDFTVLRLRKKIELDPSNPLHILTVRGIGFRFQPLDDAPEPELSNQTSEHSIRLHDRVLDLHQACVVGPGGRIPLTKIEVGLLTYLDQRRGLLVPREELLQNVWGYAAGSRTGTVSTTLHRLRTKLEEDPTAPRHLVSVRGAGVRFEPGSAPTPLALDRFVGRTAELAELAKLAATRRWVTLVGMGGMGKTRLAQAMMEQVSSGKPTHARWVSLSDAGGETRALALIRRALGVPSTANAGEDHLVHRIGRALARLGESWLVLDGGEHVVAGLRRWVPRWLASAPEVRIIVTSRESLRGTAEQQFAVGPMPVPEAVELLQERKDQAGIPPRVSRERLGELAGALEGIPLAVELAAGRIRATGIDALLRQLPRRLDSLREPSRLPRMATLRAAIEWSWTLLEPHEQRALVECTVFRGPFSVTVAEQVLTVPSPVDVLTGLVNKSFLHPTMDEQGQVVYRLLDTVRLFAEEHVDQDEPVRRRHLHAYVERVKTWRAERDGPTHAAVVRAFRAELGNVLEAHRFAMQHELDEAADIMVDAFALTRSEPVGEFLERMQQTLATLQDRPVAELQLGIGQCLERLEDPGALAALNASLEHAEREHDAPTLLRTHLALAQWHRESHDAARCAHHLDQATAGAQRARMHEVVPQISLQRALLASEQQHDDTAWPLYAAAIVGLERVDHPLLVARVRAHRGRYRDLTGDADGAHDDLTEGLRAVRRVGDLAASAQTYRDLAEHFLRTGERTTALEHAQAAVEHAEAAGRPFTAAWCQLTVARVQLDMGAAPEGAGLVADALNTLLMADPSQPQAARGKAVAHALLGFTHHRAGRLEAARHEYARGVRPAARMIGRRWSSLIGVFDALAAHQQGAAREARDAVERCAADLPRPPDTALVSAVRQVLSDGQLTPSDALLGTFEGRQLQSVLTAPGLPTPRTG